jgi:siroheme synthase-like protein
VTTETKTESAVEIIKRASNYVRGDLASDLANDQLSVTNDSEQLLKFHGIYTQDNRDVRRKRTLAGEGEVNDALVLETGQERIWLNVVDDPGRSSFYFMALHRQGDATAAVTTEGAAPALAQEIRSHVAQRLPGNLAVVATTLRQERRALHERGETTEGLDRRSRIRKLLDVVPMS